MGFDYGVEMYDRWHREAPSIPAMSSETSSAYSDRGVVSNDRALGHVRDYDTEHPSWGETSQVAWQAILSRPWVAGGFTWTGWDYRGEPTPYAWPDKSSHFGILDQVPWSRWSSFPPSEAGFWKHRAYWYQACWTSEPVIHLLPHWNWCQSCANTCPSPHTHCFNRLFSEDHRGLGLCQRGPRALPPQRLLLRPPQQPPLLPRRLAGALRPGPPRGALGAPQSGAPHHGAALGPAAHAGG